MKRQIWLSENKWGTMPNNGYETCSRHFSKSAAMKAAKKCQKKSGIKHRVRKQG